MDSRALKRGRLVLLAACAAVAALVALPAGAYAHTTTRIVATTSTTVVRDTAGVNPWLTKTLTATLQKKSGTKYVALKSRTVKLYRYDLDLLRNVYVTSKKTSSTGKVTFAITGRGKYKLYYAGSSTMKAATKYSTFYENIGLRIVEQAPDVAAAITFEPIALTAKYWVNATYDVEWNTEAWDGAVALDFEAFFVDVDGSEGDWVWYKRDFMTPGPVEFNYKVDAENLGFPYLKTYANAFVDEIWDPYIIATPDVEYTSNVAPSS